MKRLYILLILLILPLIVNAETLTYDVCDTCEYTELYRLETVINNISNLSDKDIIINVNKDTVGIGHYGNDTNKIKSMTINGINGATINPNYGMDICADNVTINNVIFNNINNNGINGIGIGNASNIIINNSIIPVLEIVWTSRNETLELNDILNIDEYSLNNLKIFALSGSNLIIKDLQMPNIRLSLIGGNYEIYNSSFNKIIHFYPTEYGNVLNDASSANIYNSKFKSLKYFNISNLLEIDEETQGNISAGLLFDIITDDMLPYDIYNVNAKDSTTGEYTNVETNVYFDKEAKLKPEDKLNLVNYLDYYTEDKEIEYTIEDESIAKIENKELIGLKEGSTKVTITTDEGHVIYRINLTVDKETIPEKIDKMTIKVPITGSVVKEWVIGLIVLIVGVIGMCSYILIKRKK